MTKLIHVNYEIYGKLKVSGNLEELFKVQSPVKCNTYYYIIVTVN